MTRLTVRWHGRGGQGSFTAARLLGHAAALHAGRHALAIPAFGPERRGAPVVCATRIADAPIHDRGPARTCEIAVVLDPGMADAARHGLVAGGRLLVNSPYGIPDATSIDGDGLARASLGRAVPGTALLGALAAFGAVPLPALEAAIAETWSGTLRDGNLRLLQAGYAAVGTQSRVAPPPRTIGTTRAAGSVPARPALRPWRAPASLAELPTGPSLPAGHLVTGFAAWRSERPEVDPAACAACGHCWLACPDGAVLRHDGAIAIDLEMCKGCGICAAACQAGAIAMAPEAGDG